MKKTKIIIPALAMLLLSTAASVSGTVAWFSMNNRVTVNGMAVTTKVSSNLLIAEENQAANYSDSIKQSREGILEPASTVNGLAFFYTINALGNGDAKTDEYTAYNESTDLNNLQAGKTKYDTTFNGTYGFSTDNPTAQGTHWTSEEIASATSETDPGYGKTVKDWKVEPGVCYAYIDYTFYIKGTSGKDDQVLYMSKCNLLYNDAAIAAGYAWRVALFADDATTTESTGNPTLRSIIGLSQASNFNNSGEVLDLVVGTSDVSSYYTDATLETQASGTAQQNTTYYGNNIPQAVNSQSTLGSVNKSGVAAQATTDIDSGENFVTKVVVRLWLEGEDVSCTNDTYADLTKAWTLDLEFKLGDATYEDSEHNTLDNGVKVIGSVPNA